jgi:hypothetical protein
MKRPIIMSVVLANVFSAAALAGQWEVQGAFESFFPSDSFWESRAFGGEAKGVYWMTQRWGIAAAAGLTEWTVDSTTAVSDIVTLNWDGDVQYIPFGMSALMRWGIPGYQRWIGMLEGGLRYMMCDSSLEVTRITSVPEADQRVEVFHVDCDDGIVARIAAGLGCALTASDHPIRIAVSGGYQFDLDKGKATENRWLHISEDLSLAGFFVDIGLIVPIP